jgi:hypothetical protein
VEYLALKRVDALCNVTQGTVQSSIYTSFEEGKLASRLRLHGELDVGINAVEVVKEVDSLFWYMRPD